MMLRRRPPKELGITLPEAMAVVAIVAILTGIGASVAWRREDTAHVARLIKAATFHARREAIGIGVQSYTADDSPRASCMPNTDLDIYRDRIEQWNCTLNQASTAVIYPCDAPTDDCDWTLTHTYMVPSSYEIDKFEVKTLPSGSWGTTTTLDSSGDFFMYRPDGSSDVYVNGGANGTGGSNEAIKLYVRPKGISDAICTSQSARCYMVNTQHNRVATIWD